MFQVNFCRNCFADRDNTQTHTHKQTQKHIHTETHTHTQTMKYTHTNKQFASTRAHAINHLPAEF